MMRVKCTPLLVSLGLAPFLLTTTGCPVKPTPLPEKPQSIARLEFTGPEEGWPPRPRGWKNVTLVPWQGIPGTLTDVLQAQIREAALQDPVVRELLGERFAYISTDEREPKKKRERDPSKPLATRVTFFSYSKNVAVEVIMEGLKVQDIKAREGYQPAEGPDEIRAAINLASRDRRLQESIKGLTGHAILLFLRKDQPGYGHRVFHVTFAKEEEDAAQYYAIVDLTEDTVLAAGPVVGK